ncbi:hypothetical protein PGT21_009335 [Puccinia graminis f. sp. tritici]|uniref:Uncharacterized protein n=1 Tax=Puccinia graminis f. sp. tritici TaxID=56615 RepID=A0A5B0NZF0_PUCGR|nr:hypothetical protein PGTUg99_033240 [Puccinia graminis f. sp. tritici]KAA1094086.1 hypothetical protein PGT21_009335 [Puccinia graminis f. sp. tritici]
MDGQLLGIRRQLDSEEEEGAREGVLSILELSDSGVILYIIKSASLLLQSEDSDRWPSSAEFKRAYICTLPPFKIYTKYPTSHIPPIDSPQKKMHRSRHTVWSVEIPSPSGGLELIDGSLQMYQWRLQSMPTFLTGSSSANGKLV